jgi:dihydroorotate dehydrogenase electron transfer subunit
MESGPHRASLYQCPVVESRSVGAYHLVALVAPELAAGSQPGQFLMVRQAVPDLDPLLPRPLGIHAVESDLVKVLIEPIGKGTQALSQAKVGDRFNILGPLGDGFDLSGKGPAVIAGGGVGVAPLAFLAEVLAGNGREVRCLLGFKTRGQAVVAELFDSTETIVGICTEDGTMGHQALVTELLDARLAEIGPEASKTEIFTCGPDPMLRAVTEVAGKYGARAQVSVAAHMACGVGACQGCVVKVGGEYQRACIEGPVFEAADIAW